VLVASFEATPRTLVRAYRACHRVFYRAIVGGCLVLILLGLLGEPSAIAAAVIMFVLCELAIRAQMRGYRCTGTVTVTIDEGAYHVTAPGQSSSREWSTFTRVQRRGDFWVLRVSRLAAMALPTAALTDEQTAAFITLMRAKSLM
jgi:hypothetical protein